MKKVLLTLFALALVASACGGSSEDAASVAPAAPATSAPATSAVPATTTAPVDEPMESFVPSGDPEKDAVATAFLVAFDSTTTFEEKLPYVQDMSGLEETVAKYIETGLAMGGVSITVSAVEIDGEEATVFYDLTFNNNPIYPDLTGSAVRTDGGWQLPRREFCSMMSNARVGCPAE